MAATSPDAAAVLPEDADRALLIGRVWDPETGGPRPVLVDGGRGAVVDLLDVAPTVSHLLELDDPAGAVRAARDTDRNATREPRWTLAGLLAAPPGEDDRAHLLAPVDLQVIKACGVTFVDSMIERVIEERSQGDPARAAEVRAALAETLHTSVDRIVPGSPEATRVKEVFLEQGMWSQYLEVGLGPDPEVFTKGPVLSAVGTGARIGVPSFSTWNNPEPELVLVVDSRGRLRGATLGNDVNLRDVEGRSALLLGMAKDNNASTALGPFVRLFDGDFTADSVRDERVSLRVEGAEDGFLLEGENDVSRLSRPFEQLVDAAHGAHHQYPDGFVLFTGTLFAPTQDRGTPGSGFTHRLGDTVTIASPHLGALVNEVGRTEELPPWRHGIGALLAYLGRQGALAR